MVELRLFYVLAGGLLAIFLFDLFLRGIKRNILKKAKSKKQVSNIKIFTRTLNVLFMLLVFLLAFFSYMRSWTGLGLMAGLLTAALGFALQRPITGIAAWIMVVLKRPFNIGDRIIIGDVKGEVYDITLSHIYLDEVGGSINSEELSGRNIMVPNHLLFENNIINYTLLNDYVLGEVVVSITYESDLDKAMAIMAKSAKKFIEKYKNDILKEPKIRVAMDASSMLIKVRFFAPIKEMQDVSSNITKEIFDRIKKEKNVEIAYPHTEIIFKDRALFKK